MSSQFQSINRDILYLLPPSIQDWLPDNHLARFIVEIVDQLDLSPIESTYKGGGKAPYHPALMVSLLFYGYATGVFSSRKLEQATHDSIAFRFITADTHPDHDTIATFRKRFLKELEALFVQILLMAQAMGFLKLGKVSLDGTKIKANASKHKAMSWKYANQLEAQLKQEVEKLLEMAEQTDQEDENNLDIPAELLRREARLKLIAEAKAELERRAQQRFEEEQKVYEEKMEARQRKAEESGKKPRGKEPKEPEFGPKDKDQINFTDEESRIMHSADGFQQCYNAQAAVDTESHLVITSHLSAQSNDKLEVEPTLKQLQEAEQQLGGEVEGLLADAGYYSEANINHCEEAKITPYISDHRERHNLPLEQRNQNPPPCPENANAKERMAHRLRTREGRQIYALRKSTVETVFGIIKHALGFRQFHLRGKESAEGEWNLVSMAWNLKRMHKLSLAQS